MLDMLGRLSFTEFHFFMVLLVAFQLKGSTPRKHNIIYTFYVYLWFIESEFLPEDELLIVELQIVPLTSLFTFAIAIVVSILLSNLFLVYQHKIENHAGHETRKAALQGDVQDKQKLSLRRYKFVAVKTSRSHVSGYSYSISIFGYVVLAFGLLLTLLTIAGASSLNLLNIEILGIVGSLVGFSGADTSYGVSVFDIITQIYQVYEGNVAIYFVGAIFLLTTTLIPMLLSVLMLYMVFARVSLRGSHNIIEAFHVIRVWCCVDVFVLAITLAVLELPTVAGGLISSLGVCESIGSILTTFVVPLGLISEENAEAGCLALNDTVSVGAYIGVLAVLALNFATLTVGRAFHAYIEDRENRYLLSRNGESINRGRLFQTQEMKEFSVDRLHRNLCAAGLIHIYLLDITKEKSTREIQKEPQGRETTPPSDVSL